MEDFDAWLRRTIDDDDPTRRFQADEARWLAAKVLLEAAPQRRRRRIAWRFAVSGGTLLLLLLLATWGTAYFVQRADQPAGVVPTVPHGTTPNGQRPDAPAATHPAPEMGAPTAVRPGFSTTGAKRGTAVQADHPAVVRAATQPPPVTAPVLATPDSTQSSGIAATEPYRRMETLSPLALRSSNPANTPALPVPVRVAPPPATSVQYRGLTGSIGPEGFAIGILRRQQYGRWSVQTTLQWHNQHRLRMEPAKSLATLRYGFGFEETVETDRPVSAQNIEGLISLSRQWRHHELEAGLLAGNRLRVAVIRETLRRSSLMPEISSAGQSVSQSGTAIQRWYTGVYAGYQYRFGHHWSVGAQLFYLPGGFWNAPNTSAASQPWQGMLGLRRYF
jgi:hypothetical protein